MHRPERLLLGDRIRFTNRFTDCVVCLSEGGRAYVVRVSKTRVTLAFSRAVKLVNNCDRDRAFFRFEGFRWCRDFNMADIVQHSKLIERGGKEVDG